MYPTIILCLALLTTWWAISWLVTYVVSFQIKSQYNLAEKPIKYKDTSTKGIILDVLAVIFWGWFYYLTH